MHQRRHRSSYRSATDNLSTAALVLALCASPGLMGCSDGGGGSGIAAPAASGSQTNGGDNGSGNQSTPATPTTVTPTYSYYVDGNFGDDANPGSEALPLKTISTALALAHSGSTIKVAEGTYDTALGEVFPLVIPAGVQLIGDVSTRGAATIIDGYGNVGQPVSGRNANAAVVGSDNALLTGFTVTTGQKTDYDYCIFANDVAFAVTSCAMIDTRRGMLWAGTANPTAIANTFATDMVGLYSMCEGTPTMEGNTFSGPRFGIETQVGNAVISDNHFLGEFYAAINITSGSPTIEGNTITCAAFRSLRAGIDCHNDSTPKLRANAIDVPSGACIRIGDTAKPDLGTGKLVRTSTTAIMTANGPMANPTAPRTPPRFDNGANAFTFATTSGAVAIEHNGSEVIEAVGNTWNGNDTVDCGTDITATSSGTVQTDRSGTVCP